MSRRLVTCPFCSDQFSENCEYVDIGVGNIQCTANQCPQCQASENGAASTEGMDEYELATNWRRGEVGEAAVSTAECRKLRDVGSASDGEAE